MLGEGSQSAQMFYGIALLGLFGIGFGLLGGQAWRLGVAMIIFFGYQLVSLGYVGYFWQFL